jgi:hypothetical protein
MPAAQQSDLREWFQDGVKEGATHMIVVVDGYDHDDFPVFVTPEENSREIAKNYDGVGDYRIMEVYDLRIDMEAQLLERRAFHY